MISTIPMVRIPNRILSVANLSIIRGPPGKDGDVDSRSPRQARKRHG